VRLDDRPSQVMITEDRCDSPTPLEGRASILDD